MSFFCLFHLETLFCFTLFCMMLWCTCLWVYIVSILLVGQCYLLTYLTFVYELCVKMVKTVVTTLRDVFEKEWWRDIAKDKEQWKVFGETFAQQWDITG